MRKRFDKPFKFLYAFIALFFFTNIQASVKLLKDGVPLPIWYSGRGTVVNTAIEIYSSDMKLVSGNSPERILESGQSCIAVGTLGVDSNFDRLISRSKIDISGIVGKWEGFHIEEMEIDGIKYLIVAGSDLRGTAYGVLELSRIIGVSPWVWWADIIPIIKKNVVYEDKMIIEQVPSVQFRGIFINDEDWGFNPWSYKNFELSDQKGNIGPKTYEKVFELLLRLRANTIWPAMHECTVPFFYVDGNKEMADKYGIVLGTSHCEPMMRNSAGEWDKKTMGDYNYKTNQQNIKRYWSKRLEQVHDSECIFTIGLRGVHDGRMEGVNGVDEETEILDKVISEQRRMISEYFKCTSDSIPQIFVPYKEVLGAYNNGLKLPDDISIVWCDDNHGYITRLSNSDEQKREGGAGVYYHISYWGKPHDYLWLASTQPGLIYKEMKRAWDYNSRRLWILNVGDIKPGEYLTTFFLDMAWNINFVSSNNVYSHQRKWYVSIFGESIGNEIDYIMRHYYRLAAERKPEHMGWSLVESSRKDAIHGLTPVVDTEYSPFAERDEVLYRISEYHELVNRVIKLRRIIPFYRQDAFFELVEYPVCAASAINEKLLYAQLSRLYSDCGLLVGKEYAQLSVNSYYKLLDLNYSYNKTVQKGKWDGMIDISPRNLPVFHKPFFSEKNIPFSEDIKVFVEGYSNLCSSNTDVNIEFNSFNKGISKVSFFDNSNKRISWDIIECPDGISIEEIPNGLIHRTDLKIMIDDTSLLSSRKLDRMVLSVGSKRIAFNLVYNKLNGNIRCEINKSIYFNASDFSSYNGDIIFYEGLGRSGKSVSVSISEDFEKTASYIGYDFVTETIGEANIIIGTIPVHPANCDGDVRIAIVVDDNNPEIISLKSDFLSDNWTENVLKNQVLTVIPYNFINKGKHSIKLYAIDNDICFDQIKIDFNKERKSYIISY